MDAENNVYTEDDLRQLEAKIDDLITTVGQLKNENTSLRSQQETGGRTFTTDRQNRTCPQPR